MALFQRFHSWALFAILALVLGMLPSCGAGDAKDSGKAETNMNDASGEQASAPEDVLDQSPGRVEMGPGLDAAVLDMRTATDVGARTAPEGFTYALLQVRLRNNGDQAYGFFDRQFYLMVGGADIQPELFAPKPDFGSSGTLAPGMAREGWLAFRMPLGQTAEALQFAVELGDEERVSLPLPTPS